MQTEVGYIQEKDYLPKPEPFYHKPKPILIDDIWKLGWEEDHILKANHNRNIFKQQVLSIFETALQDQPGIKSLFKPVMDAAIIEFNKNTPGGDMEIVKIVNTAPTFGMQELQDLKDALLLKLQEL